MTVYVVVEVAFKTPENLRSLMGLAAYPFLLFLYSNNKRKVDFSTMFYMCLLYKLLLLKCFVKVEHP